MEKIKLASELLEVARQENGESDLPSGKAANEIRTLNELELMVTSGGEAIVCW
jgi:hypothetical protein